MNAPSPIDRREYMKAFRARQRQSGHARITVTLTSDEFERMSSSAEAHSERITTHLKTCAFSGLDAQYLVPPDIAERLDTVVAILRGIGNNLNQLARHSNEMKYFLDTQEVRLQVKRMEDVVRDFVTLPLRTESTGSQ